MSIEDSQQDPQQPSKPLIDVWTLCSANGIVLTKPQMDSLERYHNDLTYWNDQVNMVSRKDMGSLWDKHILHSLMILKYAKLPLKSRVLDIGTGGGLPGIPLKIAREDLRMTLIDSIAKKAKLAKMFAEHTGLKNIKAVSGRAEELVKDPHYVRSFDVIVSRAVAKTEQMITWTRPLLAKGGMYVFLKGGDLTEELQEARSAFPGIIIKEHLIEAFGIPSFKQDEKKVITCRFSS